MTVIDEISAERNRQITGERWSLEHDDEHIHSELASAAAAYVLEAVGCHEDFIEELWPWDPSWWKPRGERRNLIRAAALIVAEIERLDRKP